MIKSNLHLLEGRIPVKNVELCMYALKLYSLNPCNDYLRYLEIVPPEVSFKMHLHPEFLNTFIGKGRTHEEATKNYIDALKSELSFISNKSELIKTASREIGARSLTKKFKVKEDLPFDEEKLQTPDW
jgi:hypothetical protein